MSASVLRCMPGHVETIEGGVPLTLAKEVCTSLPIARPGGKFFQSRELQGEESGAIG